MEERKHHIEGITYRELGPESMSFHHNTTFFDCGDFVKTHTYRTAGGIPPTPNITLVFPARIKPWHSN